MPVVEVPKFLDVPKGKMEVESHDAAIGASYARWAPGTGYVLQVFASDVPAMSADFMGGDRFLSLDVGGVWVGHAMSRLVGLYHESLVDRFFSPKSSGSSGDRDVLLYAALLNWIFLEHEPARNYAMECWERSGVGRRRGR